MMNNNFVKLAHEQFVKLCIKLSPGDWTVLAAIIEECDDGGARVVSLATGVKCLPRCKLRDSNDDKFPFYYDLVHDQHAEILCRRALLRYLLEKQQGESEMVSNNKYRLYVSKAPCGDASQPAPSPTNPPKRFKSSREGEIGRGREDYGRIGVVRTKPGRADSPPTDSVSCSDKLALWGRLGLQGPLVKGRVIMESIIIGGELDESAVRRGLKERVGLGEDARPLIFTTNVPWEHAHGTRPSPVSHVWWEGAGKVETLVDGRLFGSRPPGDHFPVKSRSSVCTSALYEYAGVSHDLESIERFKRQHAEYQREKGEIVEKYLKGWPRGL